MVHSQVRHMYTVIRPKKRFDAQEFKKRFYFTALQAINKLALFPSISVNRIGEG